MNKPGEDGLPPSKHTLLCLALSLMPSEQAIRAMDRASLEALIPKLEELLASLAPPPLVGPEKSGISESRDYERMSHDWERLVPSKGE